MKVVLEHKLNPVDVVTCVPSEKFQAGDSKFRGSRSSPGRDLLKDSKEAAGAGGREEGQRQKSQWVTQPRLGRLPGLSRRLAFTSHLLRSH